MKAISHDIRFEIQDPIELEFIYDSKIENQIEKSTQVFNRNV